MYDLSLKIRRCVKFASILALATSIFFAPTAIADEFKLVVLGDSLSAGYNLPAGAGFPEQLQKKLRQTGYQVKVINAGVSGDTTAGGLARLDWAVGNSTDAVIVELGANDALRGVAPARTRKNLDRLIGKLKAKGVKILLAGMEAPRNLGRPYVKAFGKIYPELARKHAVPLYPFFLQGVALNSPLLLADGLHPNERGVARMVKNILPYVTRLLAKPADVTAGKS